MNMLDRDQRSSMVELMVLLFTNMENRVRFLNITNIFAISAVRNYIDPLPIELCWQK
jgi:hypothetical protein